MFWQLAVPILGLVCSGVFQNFLGNRTVLVPFVTILCHTNGQWSCPVRSFFVRTFLPSDLWYVFFQESIFGSSDVYGADDFPRFSASGRDDGALCTRWRVGSLVSCLCEGLKAFGGCLVLLGCFFFSHRINRAFYMMNFRISTFAFCDQVCFCFRRDISNLWILYVPIKVPKV